MHAAFGGLIGFGSGFLGASLGAGTKVSSPGAVRGCGVTWAKRAWAGVAGLPFVVTWFNATSELSHQQSVGTTFLAVTPAVFTGAVAHIVRGNVPFVMFVPIAAGAALGAGLGAGLHLVTPTEVLQGALALSFAAAGLRGALALRRLLAVKEVRAAS